VRTWEGVVADEQAEQKTPPSPAAIPAVAPLHPRLHTDVEVAGRSLGGMTIKMNSLADSTVATIFAN